MYWSGRAGSDSVPIGVGINLEHVAHAVLSTGLTDPPWYFHLLATIFGGFAYNLSFVVRCSIGWVVVVFSLLLMALLPHNGVVIFDRQFLRNFFKTRGFTPCYFDDCSNVTEEEVVDR